MNNIKFRVWCKDYNEWEKDEIFINQEGIVFHTHGTPSLKLIRPEKHIVQFFTGFKDKNDKEIYDGDIAKYTVSYDVGSRKFIGKIGQEKEYSNGWAFISEKERYRTFIKDAEKIKVIGNIFENPELLEK